MKIRIPKTRKQKKTIEFDYIDLGHIWQRGYVSRFIVKGIIKENSVPFGSSARTRYASDVLFLKKEFGLDLTEGEFE